jgi:hypothetical protein
LDDLGSLYSCVDDDKFESIKNGDFINKN